MTARHAQRIRSRPVPQPLHRPNDFSLKLIAWYAKALAHGHKLADRGGTTDREKAQFDAAHPVIQSLATLPGKRGRPRKNPAG